MRAQTHCAVDADVVSLEQCGEFAEITRIKRNIRLQSIRIRIVQIHQPASRPAEVPEAYTGSVRPRRRTGKTDGQPARALGIQIKIGVR